MTLLNPAALWFGLLAIPVLALYFLKLRRRERMVSSLLLWRPVIEDRQANALWQRLRRNLLLILQLIALVALVGASARPARTEPGFSADNVVVLLDATASMQASDVEPDRFSVAVAEVAQLVDRLPRGARAALIEVAEPARVLTSLTSDRSRFQSALETAIVSSGTGDWETALATAFAMLPGGRESGLVLVVTDGSLPQGSLQVAPVEVRTLPVGTSGENLALTAFSSRTGDQGTELFVRVTNFGARTRNVVVSLMVDQTLVRAEETTLPPGGERELVWQELPPGEHLFQARLSPPAEEAAPLDILSLDDEAALVSGSSPAARTLLVTPGNIFLESVLAAHPRIEAYRTSVPDMGTPVLPDEGFDLYVLDGPVAALPPEGNVLWVNPPSNPLFEITGSFTPTLPIQITDSAIARSLPWDTVHIRQASALTAPDWADVLVRSPEGPLVLAGETAGRRFGLIAFDLHQSDLPLQAAFPVLMAGLLDDLADGPNPLQGSNLEPGDSVRIPPVSGAVGIEVTTPAGDRITMPLTEEGALFDATRSPGVYLIRYTGEGSQESLRFTVSLPEPGESDVLPAGEQRTGGPDPQARPNEDMMYVETWRLLAVAGSAVLCAEWWVYHRRQRLRDHPELGIMRTFSVLHQTIRRRLQ